VSHDPTIPQFHDPTTSKKWTIFTHSLHAGIPNAENVTNYTEPTMNTRTGPSGTRHSRHMYISRTADGNTNHYIPPCCPPPLSHCGFGLRQHEVLYGADSVACVTFSNSEIPLLVMVRIASSCKSVGWRSLTCGQHISQRGLSSSAKQVFPAVFPYHRAWMNRDNYIFVPHSLTCHPQAA